jgi:integrase
MWDWITALLPTKENQKFTDMANKRQKDYRIRNGKVFARKDVMRLAENRAHAKELAAQMRRELKDHGERIVDADKLKFEELAGYYEADKVKPAQYHEGRKVAGLRSLSSVRYALKTLTAHFGRRFMKTITPTDIEKFKAKRLDTEARRGGKPAADKPNGDKPTGGKLTIASVNRELELLRAIFAYARREGWLVRSPFERLRGIISKADERRRDRVLSFDEEKRLLDACDDPRRRHLRPILICALDTAMRRGEIIKLCWRDVDLDAKTITVTAMNSKTARERTVGMTARLHDELIQLWEKSPKDLDVSVYGIKDNFQNGFASICSDAKIEDFRFHDCRHTCITRWVRAGLPIAEIMRLSGHSTLQAFAIYANSTPETIRRGADALDALRADVENVEQASELIN